MGSLEQLKMHSSNLVDANIEKIAGLFPNCITEAQDDDGKLKKAIDFDLLRQELSHVLVEGDQERYRLDWPGKKEAILTANAPIAKTLRPCREESVNFDTTQNLFIEGDNLDALKLLQENYLGKVKMIYIDPPYNTGSDFIYKDDFSDNTNDFFEKSYQQDTDGNRLVSSREGDGRFHSNWLTMMYSRLKLAKNLMQDDGVIFISIDDSEVGNLKSICNEIFGSNNFIAQLIWQNKKGGGNDSVHIATEHEYILVFAKNKGELHAFYESYSQEYAKRYKEEDNLGKYYWDTFKRKSGKQYYAIECPDGTLLENDEDGNPISWLRSEKRFQQDIKDGEIRFLETNKGWSVQFKQRMPEGKKPRSIFKTDNLISDKGTTSVGSADVYKHFKKDVFSNPKPVELLEFLIGFSANKPNDIVLDFFSGSGTIAEAIFNLNLTDSIERKFIAVQLPEIIDIALTVGNTNAKRIAENAISVLDEINKAYVITELSKERIRRAGQKILADNADKEGIENLDIGFRVLKVDSSNMKDVYYTPDSLKKANLDFFESNIKEDRTDEDLLFQVMLDWGLELSLAIEPKQIADKTVYFVAENSLVACFQPLSMELIDQIAQYKPLRFVSAERSIVNDHDKTNIRERFKQLSPETDVKFL